MPGRALSRRARSGYYCLEEPLDRARDRRDGSDELVAQYTYAPGYIDAVALQERDLNSDGDFADDDEVTYYHANTLYSVMALTDADQNVVERYRYDAYGAVTVLDAEPPSPRLRSPGFSDDSDGASDVDNPCTFTGRRLDAEGPLMQYRHRYYDADLGRFITRDPAGYQDGYCLYCYVASCPSTYSDPTGQVRLPPDDVLDDLVKIGFDLAMDVAAEAGKAIAEGIIRGVQTEVEEEALRFWSKVEPGMTTIVQVTAAAGDAAITHSYLERSEDGAYSWCHAHCVQMCVTNSLHGRDTAFRLSQMKEWLDTAQAILRSPPHQFSAWQESDIAANLKGVWAPDMRRRCPGLTGSALHECVYDRCRAYCTRHGWGPETAPTGPGPLGGHLWDKAWLDWRPGPGWDPVTVEWLRVHYPYYFREKYAKVDYSPFTFTH